jgi:hypothetical protein
MVITRTTPAKTSHDHHHDDRKTSDRDYVSCHRYHLMDVVVTMSNYVVATMTPMLGDHKDNINKYKQWPQWKQHEQLVLLLLSYISLNGCGCDHGTPMLGDHEENINKYKQWSQWKQHEQLVLLLLSYLSLNGCWCDHSTPMIGDHKDHKDNNSTYKLWPIPCQQYHKQQPCLFLLDNKQGPWPWPRQCLLRWP